MNEEYETIENTTRSYLLFKKISELEGRDGKDYSAVAQELVELFSKGHLYLAADYPLGRVSRWWAYTGKPVRRKTVWDVVALGEAMSLTDSASKVLSKIYSGHPWFELHRIEPEAFKESIFEGFEL